MPAHRHLPVLFIAVLLLAAQPVAAAVQTQITTVLEQMEVSGDSRHPKKVELLQSFMNDSWLNHGCYVFYADYVAVRRDEGPRPAGKVKATLELLRRDGETVQLGAKSGRPMELFAGVFLIELDFEHELSLQHGDSLLWTFKFRGLRRFGAGGAFEVSGHMIQFPEHLCALI